MNSVLVRITADSTDFENVELGTGKGMHLVCNGWVLSAQAGWGNYCSSDPSRNRDLVLTPRTLRSDCEIALWQFSGGDLIRLDGNSVMGWVSWGKVIEITHWLMCLDSKPTEDEVRKFVLDICKEKRNDQATDL